MTVTTVDAAAQAAIGAAARELHLPTVRAESHRLAEIAVRERRTHLGYLAEVLSAEVDDRSQRRRARRISEARMTGACHEQRVGRFSGVFGHPGLQDGDGATSERGDPLLRALAVAAQVRRGPEMNVLSGERDQLGDP
jgi:hypothetical protein